MNAMELVSYSSSYCYYYHYFVQFGQLEVSIQGLETFNLKLFGSHVNRGINCVVMVNFTVACT